MSQPTRPAPTNFPRISTALYYDDPRAAIDWLCRVFGFVVQIKVEGDDGAIHHSELRYGDGLVMVGAARDEEYQRTPAAVAGGNTQNLFVYVDDVEAHHQHAKASGARIVSPPETTDYGPDHWVDRGYHCVDVGGHHWWFAQRLRG